MNSVQQAASFFLLGLLLTGCGNNETGNGGGGDTDCTTLECRTMKYNLLLADVDFNQPAPRATNVEVIVTSGYQDMTHPRVSPDNNWVAYTTYHVTNNEGCASLDSGYVDTEIKATRLDGSDTRTIISMTSGELNSNNYWYGDQFDFTFLSGPPGATGIYRAQTDADMQLISGPTEVTIPETILPLDPMAISDSQLVYTGIYDNSGSVKSVFMQSINPPDIPDGLTLGRDAAGATLYNGDIMENDPKLSPDGTHVAFMRRAPNSGMDGFGWRLFVVPIANPLEEVNISTSLGTSLLNNDVLPEWVDNTTLVFANIDSTETFNTRTIWVMRRDGSDRKQVELPEGFRYSDVYPFNDDTGNHKIVVSAEKIDAVCGG